RMFIVVLRAFRASPGYPGGWATRPRRPSREPLALHQQGKGIEPRAVLHLRVVKDDGDRAGVEGEPNLLDGGIEREGEALIFLKDMKTRGRFGLLAGSESARGPGRFRLPKRAEDLVFDFVRGSFRRCAGL